MPGNSTARSRKRTTLSLPKKPYDGFPLGPHVGGKWVRKIRGHQHYFGRWYTIVDGSKVRVAEDGWKEALAEYDRVKADLHAGRTPGRTKSNELTVGGLCNRFLEAKSKKVKAGELSARMWQDYKAITDRLVAQFGPKRLVEDLAPADFEELRAEIASRCGVYRRANEIIRTRSVFKFGKKNGLLDREVLFGSEFSIPDRAAMRRHKAESDKKLFAAAEILLMLDALLGKEVTVNGKKGAKKVQRDADPQLRAAILLGINAGAGNSDLASVQRKHVDLDAGWLDFPRVKTGTPRRTPLWPETVDAIRSAIAMRPAAKDKADAGCVFLTNSGTRLVRVGTTSRTDYIGREFHKLLRALNINGRRGLGLYSLRHTFATVALQTGDRDTVRALMGHVEGDVLALYDETGPSDERRLKVTGHVRNWLFAQGGAA